MPAYSASTKNLPITALYVNTKQTVFSAEQPTTGTASQAVHIPTLPGGEPQSISVEISFAGAPGAFGIQVQTADTDADAFYNSEPFGGANPGIIAAVNAQNTARVELQIRARFVRLLVSAQSANAVNLTANISR